MINIISCSSVTNSICIIVIIVNTSIIIVTRIVDSLRGSSVKIGTIQIILAWPLREDDTHTSRSVNTFIIVTKIVSVFVALFSVLFACYVLLTPKGAALRLYTRVIIIIITIIIVILIIVVQVLIHVILTVNINDLYYLS